jgi:hypothetical protein
LESNTIFFGFYQRKQDISDPQKAARVQAMIADFFGEKWGHYRSKERISMSWSQPQELYNFG